jgi:3-dehydroquinate synthetase
MERSVWTDERLGDRFDEIGRRFDRVDRDAAEFRGEMREGFAQVRGEINDLRTELRTVMYRVGGGVMVGLIGVIAAILARGV